MQTILDKLIEDSSLNPKYNSQAFYLSNRELFVEWMQDLAEKLQVHAETLHHSVTLFDSYLSRASMPAHLSKLAHF